MSLETYWLVVPIIGLCITVPVWYGCASRGRGGNIVIDQPNSRPGGAGRALCTLRLLA
jgi:hypothetical protein